jgi:hypothetical protein
MLLRHSDGRRGARDRRWRRIEGRRTRVQTGHNPPTMVKAGGSRPSEFRWCTWSLSYFRRRCGQRAPPGFSRAGRRSRATC